MRICSISSLTILRFLHLLTNFQKSPRLFCWRFPKSHSFPRSSKLVTSTTCSVANEGCELTLILQSSGSLVEEAAGGEYAAKAFKETNEKGFRDSEGCACAHPSLSFLNAWLLTEVLKQLSSMGRLVFPEMVQFRALLTCNNISLYNMNRALLRHRISIWIDVPLDLIAMEEDLKDGHASCISYIYFREKMTLVIELYKEMGEGYATADATVITSKKLSLCLVYLTLLVFMPWAEIARQLGYDDISAVTAEDVAMENLKEMQKLTIVKRVMEAAARPF
ncbi:hypothetical protein RJ641_007163 [Dillenia turbinata]|uniref:Uncharacterized protein n=1 Tax=Dillenia turbinata TaxID=194707 RepID=A0AAN8VJL5_9MAGN